MTDGRPETVDQFRLLASFIAGSAVEVALTASGERAYTDGQVIFVAPAGDDAGLRRQVLVQSALLGAGSLNPLRARQLRTRATLARRYLALEGQRVLFDLAERLPLPAGLRVDVGPMTATADESLQIARSRVHLADPPDWFGVIKPSRLLTAAADGRAGHGRPDHGTSAEQTAVAEGDDDEDEDGPNQKSAILRLFENPLVNSRVVSDLLRKILGTSRARGADAAGDEMAMGAARRALSVSADGVPAPTLVPVGDSGMRAPALGRSATLYPEWDTFAGRYRPDWCRVICTPTAGAADISAAAVARDDVLRRRLARVGLGMRTLRARADGDELDIEALIGVVADTRSGYSPPHHVYIERRKLARDLSVLVLLDASGSATDADPHGRAVHEHQRLAAATLTATLEELGDRVALYAFRSEGRGDVRLLELKTFAQRFGAAARSRLHRVQPSGYTRLGAAIRGAGALLETAGTPNRLLLVLSDGHPYDHDYEGRYAEADTRRALDELNTRGVAALCLSLASDTELAVMNRVFGPAAHVSAATLAELSPRMDQLFLSALRAADLR